jgi:DNA-binding SARP family transcriptional activator
MDFRVLGPLEVWGGDRPLSLGGAKQRALLAMLLLDANRVVSTDSLAAALWGEVAPERAESALEVHVAALRKLLDPERDRRAPGVLVTRAPGYLLRVDPEDVDRDRFERLVDEGRRAMDTDPSTAAERLREAEALWRGGALCDVDLEGAARATVRRLDEERLSAIEDRVHLELQLGRHAAMVAELARLVTAHPERERLHAQRMLALYRCGLRTEALTAYHEARRVLDPSPRLQGLERAMLDGDPRLTLPARPAPVRVPAAPAAPVRPAAAEPPPGGRRGLRLLVSAVVRSLPRRR